MLLILDGSWTRCSMCETLPTVEEEMLFGAASLAFSADISFTFLSSSELFSSAHGGSGRYDSSGKSKAWAKEPIIQVESMAAFRRGSSACSEASTPAASSGGAPLMHARQYHRPICSKGDFPPESTAAFADSLMLLSARAVSRTSHDASKDAKVLMCSTMASNLGRSWADSSGLTFKGAASLEPASLVGTASLTATSPRALKKWKAQTFRPSTTICCFTSCLSAAKPLAKRLSTSGASRATSCW
mmetsp:Transcript_8962/g.15261  ORF Transcript_8962/g.15261 Transcript_8962/m.15261 type:complete len:244 (-) Transcript_8962:1491-2222(-)